MDSQGDCAYFGIDWTDDLVYQEPEIDVHESAQHAKVAKAGGISLDSCFKKVASHSIVLYSSRVVSLRAPKSSTKTTCGTVASARSTVR